MVCILLAYSVSPLYNSVSGVLVSDRLSADIIDRLVIARLDIDPQKMEYVVVI